jgi:RNA polymerase sigma factor (sigma-70 family)
MTDLELLRKYCLELSEEAFSELFHRHIDWVYGVCRRQVKNTALAEDVAQAVFVTLARKGASLPESVSITGWLFTTARYASMSALKIERRRFIREQRAAAMHEPTLSPIDDQNCLQIEPMLDDALARLRDSDREAVILRFFRGMSHEAIGDALKISADGARKRVGRAVAQLRKKLNPHRAGLTESSLAMLMTQLGHQPAPANLAPKCLTALKNPVAGKTGAILKNMARARRLAAAKIAGSLIAVAVAAAAGVTFLSEHDPAAPPPPASAAAAVDPAPASIPPFNLDQVQTFCVAGNENGLDFTTYYDRKRGYLQHIAAPGWSAIKYVSGDTEWDRRDGQSLILRKRPMKDLAGLIAELESELDAFQGAKLTRQSESDADIEGTHCEAYRLETPTKDIKSGTIFIDSATGRPARIKTGDSSADVTITYDPPVSDSIFAIPVVAGSTISDARDYFEKKYPLEGALFTREGVGQVFAVHEATQDADGCFHIVCSTRITAPVRSRLANTPDDQGLVKFKMDSRAGLPFRYLDLAELEESGFQVSYLLVIPASPSTNRSRCMLPVTMGSSDEVLRAGGYSVNSRAGRDIHFPVTLIIPAHPGAPTAIQFEGAAYDNVAPLVGLMGKTEMTSPGFSMGLSNREDCLIEVQQKLTHYLPIPH